MSVEQHVAVVQRGAAAGEDGSSPRGDVSCVDAVEAAVRSSREGCDKGRQLQGQQQWLQRRRDLGRDMYELDARELDTRARVAPSFSHQGGAHSVDCGAHESHEPHHARRRQRYENVTA